MLGAPRSRIRATVPEVLDLVGLAGMEKRFPHQLSGGEQQRVAIARAFVNRPPILLADEPTGNLDPGISLEIVQLLDRINRTGTTVVMATHDFATVDAMRKRVIRLDNGVLVGDVEAGDYTTGEHPARRARRPPDPGPGRGARRRRRLRRRRAPPAERPAEPTSGTDRRRTKPHPQDDPTAYGGVEAPRATAGRRPGQRTLREDDMRIQFLLGEIGNGLRRNLSMALSVVIVTMISMYLLGLGLMGQRQVDTMKDYWYDRVQVTVLLCAEKTRFTNCAGEPTTDAQRTAIRAELDALKPTVSEVFYESRDEAFDRFKQTYQNSPLARAGESYFADSYRVNLNDPSKFDVVASSIKGMPGVADVQDQKKLLEKFFTFMNTVSWAAIALSSLMVLAAVMLISTTIRQTAFSRRRETGIMRLVGASNFTIRFPFVMETVIASVLGAVLAMGMLWATVRYGVVGFLSETLTDTAFIGVADVFYVAPFIIIGVVACRPSPRG